MLIPAHAVEARIALGAVDGRRFTQENAWAALLLASGLSAAWLERRERSRIRRYLAQHPLASLRARLASRGRVEELRVHSGVLPRLREDPALMLTGASASSEFGLGLVGGPEMVDAYISAANLPALRERYALRTSRDPNVRLRVVDGEQAALPAEHVAPLAAVALDLLDDPEPRLQQAGQAALARLAK